MSEGDKKETDISTNQEYVLTEKNIIFLFVYYIFLLIGGAALAVRELIWVFDIIGNQPANIYYLLTSLLVSFGGSASFSAVYYMRKLYKVCTRKKLKKKYEKAENMGYFMYFFTRPLFAILFSILLVAMMLGGVFVISGHLEYVLNQRFILVSFIASSSLGVSIGKTIDWYTKNGFKNLKKYGGADCEGE